VCQWEAEEGLVFGPENAIAEREDVDKLDDRTGGGGVVYVFEAPGAALGRWEEFGLGHDGLNVLAAMKVGLDPVIVGNARKVLSVLLDRQLASKGLESLLGGRHHKALVGRGARAEAEVVQGWDTH
jgi:hypothetical protein